MAERERGLERVELVRRREHLPRLGLRQRAARRVRQVLLLDRGDHRFGIAGQPRVLGPDVPLEIGKLAHELRGLVGLRQARSLQRRLAAAELARQPAQAVGLVGEGARPLEEGDRAEVLGKLVDPAADVPLEREARVVEPALEHVLVPGEHELRIAAVGHEGKAAPAEREVALVRLHRRHDRPAPAAAGSARRSCPRARAPSRRDRRPLRARRPDRSSPRSRRAPRRSGAAALPRLARHRPPEAGPRTPAREGSRPTPCVKRCPKLVSPTTVSSSSFASRQRTGRAKRMPLSSQRIDFENASPRTIASRRSGSTSAEAGPAARRRGSRRARRDRPP